LSFNFEEGEILLVDKPLTWTSFQVVNKLKYLVKAKCGHAGTLDPLATGLLVVATGKATKKIEDIQNQIKEYTGEFFLGATTPSYDLETAPVSFQQIKEIKNIDFEKITQSFVGDIEQVPPIFSAIKIKGKRAYNYAREGEEVKIKARTIKIFEFETQFSEPNIINFRVVCTKGTYIRSLAHDFGLACEAGAYLKSLRRTKIGELCVENAKTPAQWEEHLK